MDLNKIANQIDEASEEVSILNNKMAALANKYEEDRIALQSKFTISICRLTALTGIMANAEKGSK